MLSIEQRIAHDIAATTDLSGAITLTLDPGAAPLAQGERDRRRRYWYEAPDAASR